MRARARGSRRLWESTEALGCAKRDTSLKCSREGPRSKVGVSGEREKRVRLETVMVMGNVYPVLIEVQRALRTAACAGPGGVQYGSVYSGVCALVPLVLGG